MANEGLKITWLRPSEDHRTSYWSVPCPSCKRDFTPRTTQFAHHQIDCVRCGVALFIDYDKETVRLVSD